MLKAAHKHKIKSVHIPPNLHTALKIRAIHKKSSVFTEVEKAVTEYIKNSGTAQVTSDMKKFTSSILIKESILEKAKKKAKKRGEFVSIYIAKAISTHISRI